MTEQTHTPGPWNAKDDIIHAPAVNDIAHVYGENLAEAYANARLMAAAPTMLDELRSLVYTNDTTTTVEKGVIYTTTKAIAKARAAIAAAEGS